MNLSKDINNIDANKDEIQSLKPKSVRTTICPIVSVISKTKAIINFHNFGLIISTNDTSNLKDKSIEIEYTGTIGKSDFKFKVKKCIK
jgi:hypothetical protein